MSVINLAERASEVIEITELEPNNGMFIGKRIERDGSVTPYPKNVKYWRQRVAQVPADSAHLFAYLREARTRNICLIRGHPANPARQPTRRQNAFVIDPHSGEDRGDHGFTDEPTRLFPIDIDEARIDWRDDPEGAIRRIVGRLGEPWSSTSFVWFFSSSHGLETETVEVNGEKSKRWTGQIGDGVVRVRLVFITDRALGQSEAVALTKIAKERVDFKLDASIVYRVQPNYIRRPLWDTHPDRDPLGDIETIGRVKGTHEYLAVPQDLTYRARWARAQGHNAVIAEHPDAVSAVTGIGRDGDVRSHLLAAMRHLLKANPQPEHVNRIDHAITIVKTLQAMVAQHADEIRANLEAHKRSWSDVQGYLPDNMADWALWLLERPFAFKRKTVRLTREKRADAGTEPSAQEIFDRVARTVERMAHVKYVRIIDERTGKVTGPPPPVELLIAPTGSRKSTEIRAAAVRYVTEHPESTVVILVPRIELGEELLEALHKEQPQGNFTAAVWRGRHRDDPKAPDAEASGQVPEDVPARRR